MKSKITIVVLLVCALVPASYFLFIASDMYVSTTKFAVRGQSAMSLGGWASLLGGSDSTSSDCYIVTEYIQSLDMFKFLDDKLHLKEHYSQSSKDFFSRMQTAGTDEDRLAYWQSVVQVAYDSHTGILTVEVRAYDAKMAQDICVAVLRKSEEFINNMSARVREDNLAQAWKEVGIAEKRYAKAKAAINAFRSENTDINPEATASSRIGIISSLEGQISMLRIDLNTKQRFMTDESFAVASLKENIDKLEEQLKREKERATSRAGTKMLPLLEQYESLKLEQEFAQNFYTTSLEALESARVRNESKNVYMEPFQYPQLPQKPMYPKRFSSAILSVVVVGLAYALGLFILAAIKEHIGV